MQNKNFLTKTRWLVTIVLLTLLGVGYSRGADLTATFAFNTDAGLSALGISKPSSGDATNLSGTYTIGNVTMSFTNGSTATRVWNSNGTLTLRVYGTTGSLIFSVPSGYKLKTIAFASKSGLTADPTGSWSSNTWTAPSNTTSATFTKTTSGSNNNGSITVTYESTASCTTPPTVTAASNNGSFWRT